MAYRYHNSKRMVWEPFLVQEDRGDDSQVRVYRYSGVWLMDNRPGNAGMVKAYDPKWTARKVCDLEREIALLQEQINHLKSIEA